MIINLRPAEQLNLANYVLTEAEDIFPRCSNETFERKLRARTSLLVICCNNDVNILSKLASNIYQKKGYALRLAF